MNRIGVLFGTLAAVFWGTSDICATFASRRLGSFPTTIISQIVSVSALTLVGIVGFGPLHLSFEVLGWGAIVGVFTGVVSSVGYFSFYKGIGLGPLAIVSPLVAADGAVAVVLAILLLHDPISPWLILMIAGILVGIILAATNIAELRAVFRQSDTTLLTKSGIRWGLLAMITFGVTLFGIGANTKLYGWFPAVFWTRFFAALTLTAFFGWQRLRTGRSKPENVVEDRKRDRFSLFGSGYGSTFLVGLLETAGLSSFTIGTSLADTSIVAAISASFALLPIVAGMTIFHERPQANQLIGVILVVSGMILLAIKPL